MNEKNSLVSQESGNRKGDSSNMRTLTRVFLIVMVMAPNHSLYTTYHSVSCCVSVERYLSAVLDKFLIVETISFLLSEYSAPC